MKIKFLTFYPILMFFLFVSIFTPAKADANEEKNNLTTQNTNTKQFPFSNYKFFKNNTKFYIEKEAYLKQSKFRLPKPKVDEGEKIDNEITGQTIIASLDKKLQINKIPAPITYDVVIEEERESVKKYKKFFTKKINERFGKWLQRSGTYLPMMKKVFRDKGLPEDLIYLSLIESGFNTYAYSRSRAAGAWQFIPGTGIKYGLRIDTWVDERRDPVKATKAAASYLSDLYGMFDSWPLALAAYNAGEGRIGRSMRRTKSKDFWELRKTRYIRRETKDYVPKFMAGVIVAKNMEKYGFEPVVEKPWHYDSLTVKKPLDLRVLSEILDLPYKTIKDLNPELRKSVTPLNKSSYTLRLPNNTKQLVEAALETMPSENRMIGKTYKVKRGDSLYRIAKKSSTSISLLMQMNNLSKKSILKPGDKIYLPSIKSHGKKSKKRPYKVVKNTKNGKKQIKYKVRRGDSLWTIARAFNVSLKNLRSWNKIWGKSIIKPGQRLTLYIK